MYKGQIDEAKGGRIEGGRWGWVWQGGVEEEIGDNCTWKTIKKRKREINGYTFGNKVCTSVK